MTALQKSPSDRLVHAAHPRIRDGKRLFNAVVTIDPSSTEAAWNRLDVNTRAVEYAELPHRLHEGLHLALGRLLRLNRPS